MERTNRKNTATFLILAVIVFAVALMAIFALAPAATATATPTAYEGGETLNLDNLQVGDIIAGAYPTVTGQTITNIRFSAERYSCGAQPITTLPSDWGPINTGEAETSLVNNDGMVCFHSAYSFDFYPLTENGELGTVWVVTEIKDGAVYFGGQSSGEQPSYDSLAVSLSEDYLDSLPWGSMSDEELDFPTDADALSITPAFSYIVDDSRDYARANYFAEIPEFNQKESVTLYIRCDAGVNASTLKALFEKGENLAVTFNGSQRKSYDDHDSSSGSTHYYYHDYIYDFGVISINYVDRESEMATDDYALFINIYGSGQGQGSGGQNNNDQQNVPEGAELWVAGVDILAAGTVSTETAGVTNGTATARYDEEFYVFILTLDNFEYSGDGCDGSVIYFKGADNDGCNRLLIQVLGENSFSCSSHIAAGMITLATPHAQLFIDGDIGNGTGSLSLRGNHFGILTAGANTSISVYEVTLLIESDVYAINMTGTTDLLEVTADSTITFSGGTRAVFGGRFDIYGGQAWDHPQNDPVDLESGIYGADALSSYFKITATRAQSSQGSGNEQQGGGNDPALTVYYEDLEWDDQLSAGTRIMYDANHSETFIVRIDGGSIISAKVSSSDAEPYYVLTEDVTVVDTRQNGANYELYLSTGRNQLPEGVLYIAGVDIVQAGGVINEQTPGIVGTVTGSATIAGGGSSNGEAFIRFDSFHYEGAGYSANGISAGIYYSGTAYLICSYSGENSLIMTGENAYGIYKTDPASRIQIWGNSGSEQDTFVIQSDSGYGIGGEVRESDELYFATFVVIGGNVTVSGRIAANISRLDVFNPEGGTVRLIGTEQAVLDLVRSNDLTGTGWSDAAGTTGETNIPVSGTGRVEVPQYKRLHFTGVTGQSQGGQGGGNDPQPTGHTHNNVTFETAWTSTTSLPDSEGSYYLTADVTIGSSWNVPEGITNLCLNGHGIKVTGVDSVIYIASGRTLNVYDCGDTVHYFDRDGTNRFAININETEGSGRNSFVGGYIAGGKGKDNQMHGGGVYVNGTFSLYGGNIIGNTLTASDNCGAGVYCNENSIFRMYGGSISYNYAQNAGCAIFGWKNCSIEIHGGEISYNKTNWSSGSAISFWNPNGYTVSLKLYGGSIHDNSSHGGEGAVNLVTASPTVGLKGGLIVQDNTTDSTAGNAALNVCVGTNPINIEGELSSNAKICIRLSSGTGVFTSGWSEYMEGEDPSDYFVSEAEGLYFIVNQDGEVEITDEAPSIPHVHDDVTFTAWESATNLPTSAGNYYLTADVTLTSTWEVPAGTTNICLNGFGIKWIGETSYSGMFYVGRDVVLNLYDCGETRHYYDLDDDQILAINIDETEGVGRGSFTGGYITGGRRPYGAGGIAWVEYGTFNMYGGTMIGNTAKQGGAVYVSESGGAFNMYGGTITHNEATGGNGGAVLVNYSAAFNMYGGSVTANMASGSGGAVQLGSTCTFNMYGGSITANRAGDSGGGVYKNTNYSVIGISGKAVITDNISNNVTNNIYVCADGDTLRILDTLTDGAAIGITLGTYGKAFTSGWKTNMNGADPAKYFFSDDESYGVYLKGGEAAILEEAPPAPVSLGEGVLYVGGVDIVTAENYTVNGTGGGKAVLSETDGKLFLTLTDYVYEGPGYSNWGEGGAIDFRTGYENGLDLTIVLVGNNTITKKDDSGIDLSHGIYYASYDHSLIIDGEGTLTISFASDRSGCFKSNGIFLEPGIFVMNGGTVLSNGGTGSEESLGIYSSQSIIFNGGSFTGNGYTTYDWHSFGIYCSNITVNGGTVSASSPLENGEDDSSAFQNSSLTINAGTVIAYGKNSFSSTYNLKCGTNSTWSIFAGEDEASATEVSSINGNSKYVRIVAQSASVHTHDYSTEWTQGETTHWHACTGDGDCDAPKKDEAAHVYGNDVNDPAYYTCSVCGYENDTLKADYEAAQQGGEPVTKYDLYIAGAQVTSENLSGDGWSYDPDTNTLTLDNFTYEGEGSDDSKFWRFNSVVTYAGDDDFRVVLVGENSITNTKTDYDNIMAFLSTADLTIGGSGSLTLSVPGTATNMSMGLCVDGYLTVDGGTITAIGGESEWRSAGICVFGKRYIQEGGSVFVRGGNAEESYGLYALGVEQIASIGDDVGSGEEFSDGITIGTGIKKFVATGNTSAIYTEATIAFKRDATAWTDAEHAANGEALAAGTYEYEALADYKSIEVMGALPSNLIIRIKAKSSVSDTYKQAVEAQLKENEKVYGIYDVTLYRVTTENGADREESIQPSDIDAGLMISIKLTIPAALRGKAFKILHVHAADDVAYVDYTLKGDGKYVVIKNVDRLSEFAFVALSSDLAPSGDQGGEGQGGQQGQGEQPGGQGQPGGGQEQGGNTGKEEGEGQVPTIEPEPEITQKDDPTIDNWTLTPQGGAGGTAQPGQGGQGQSGQGGQGQSGQGQSGQGGQQGGAGQGSGSQPTVPSVPAVTVALEDTEPQPGISVEVEVKTEVSEDVKESDKKTRALALQKDDEIAVVYEVKLIRSTIENGIEIKEEIQPSDIKPGTVVVINMLIPEALRGKPFRMLHVHSEEDVKEVSYTVSEDGTTATVRVDRLSEFVFVGKAASGEEEIEPNKIPDGAIAGIVIGGSLGTLLLGFIIFFLLKRRKENDAEEAATDSAPKAKKSKKQAVGQKAAVTKQESALIVAATVAGEEENVGFYRITEDDAGKCTFALFYEDGDNLSKEMGVFDGNEEAKAAIRALRAAARGAKAENRVRHSEESVPAPKFVLDVTEKGVYYYVFLAEDGAVLLRSVQYLNEKRCLEDLKKTLVCVATDRIVDRNGEVRDDVAASAAVLSEERTENAPAEEAIEEVAATQSVEEPAPTEVEATEAPSEAVSLKEHLAVAKATVSHGNVNKQYVADYLKRKYAGDAEVNTRGNKTKTGLPLADTHYAVTEENKKCFVYVYETAGTTMLLVKVDDQYGRALAKKHPIVKRSAFPKSKSPWYSVILDDSFTSEEVDKILDDAFVSNGGKRAADDGVSLKKTLAMAKATASSDARTKKGIAEFLKDKFGEAAEVNTRGNKTKTGLPLADTHYAVFEGGKRCFVYVYETEGSVALLLRLPETYAASKSKDGQKLIRSAFPKSKDAWYSVIADDTYDEAALQELLITAYNFAK